MSRREPYNPAVLGDQRRIIVPIGTGDPFRLTLHDSPSAIRESTVQWNLIKGVPIANASFFSPTLNWMRCVNQRRSQPQEFAGRDVRSQCVAKLEKHLTNFD
jgi:hypothetical protein